MKGSRNRVSGASFDLYNYYPNKDVVYSLSVIFTTGKYSGKISDEDSEVLEHRFFKRDEIPANLFPCDSRAILDWAKGTDKVIVD